MGRRSVRAGLLAIALATSSCALPLLPGAGPCTPVASPVPLPPELPESSGLAVAGSGALGLWSHNDSGGEPVLFRLDLEGALLQTVHVEGARNVDWEAMAAGPCPEGRCLYIADTGDNLLRRTDPAIYRVAEPEPGAESAGPAVRFPIRLPEGPQDIEAMALLPDGHALLVSKGWGTPVAVFRTPRPLMGAGWSGPEVLEKVQLLGPARRLPRLVTGAAATPAGDLVAIRTYEALRFYRPGADGVLEPLDGGWVNLRPLREAQGEAVVFLPGNRIALSSEAGPWGTLGQLSVLRCDLPGHAW